MTTPCPATFQSQWLPTTAGGFYLSAFPERTEKKIIEIDPVCSCHYVTFDLWNCCSSLRELHSAPSRAVGLDKLGLQITDGNKEI